MPLELAKSKLIPSLETVNSADAMQMEITNSSSNPVRIVVPQGTMFEQQNWNGNQNLVVKEDVWIDIQPGQSGTFPLPAFCANSSGGSPNVTR